MPEWAMSLSSLIVTLLFLLGVYALAASPYGDWVREFYAKRDKLYEKVIKSQGRRETDFRVTALFVT